ncbi:hypothetical protein [uncultured Williamsia sp.]|uniref:hypothetical protein n=1 Tax=uncultured Williamsia sp. TaxID=259311 RepID=UPI0026303B21|nr:hypothetical protein [uncultured Williamsia sp.]
MREHVLAAADEAAAHFAYGAASGSPDSQHLAFACPTIASRVALSTSVESIRRHHDLERTALAVIEAGGSIRLPGSASLKGGHPCTPIDEDGRPTSGVAAVRRLQQALTSTALAGSPLTASAELAADRAATTRRGGVVRRGDDVVINADTPRAWRRIPAMTPRQFKILTTEPKAGQRSDAATAAAWVLWARGIRSWSAASASYRRWPAFVKFVERDDEDHQHGRDIAPGYRSNCQRHWESIVTRARALRPKEVDPGDAGVIAAALAEVACWDDPTLVAAAVAVIHRRFSDGYGITSRPIAVRDLSAWLSSASLGGVNALLHSLVRRGLLVLTIAHDRHTAPGEANRYTLAVPSTTYRTESVHEVTDPERILHPLWSLLGHAARQVLHHTPTTPTRLPDVAGACGLAPGTLTHGVRLLLAKLEAAGLVQRHGSGRGTRWSRTGTALDEAAATLGVPALRSALLTRINLEREAWHRLSRQAVERLRRRLAARRTKSGTQLALISGGGWSHPKGGSTNAGRQGRRRQAWLLPPPYPSNPPG